MPGKSMWFATVCTLAFAICGRANRDKGAGGSQGITEDLEHRLMQETNFEDHRLMQEELEHRIEHRLMHLSNTTNVSSTPLRKPSSKLYSALRKLSVIALLSSALTADAFASPGVQPSGVRPFQKVSNTAFAPRLPPGSGESAPSTATRVFSSESPSEVSSESPSEVSSESPSEGVEKFAMSRAIPFLTEPKNLKGYVGDVGFDPLGFADWYDIKWLREAEIKHGRASMLATLGFVAQEYLTLPGMTHVDDSNLAPSVVGLSSMVQLVAWMGVLEYWTNQGKVTMEDMFEDEERVPGEFGFDPLGLSSGQSQAYKDAMALKEIKNGRLAMLAIGGMIHHNWITGHALF